jgi:hypothetical protein
MGSQRERQLGKLTLIGPDLQHFVLALALGLWRLLNGKRTGVGNAFASTSGRALCQAVDFQRLSGAHHGVDFVGVEAHSFEVAAHVQSGDGLDLRAPEVPLSVFFREPLVEFGVEGDLEVLRLAIRVEEDLAVEVGLLDDVGSVGDFVCSELLGLDFGRGLVLLRFAGLSLCCLAFGRSRSGGFRLLRSLAGRLGDRLLGRVVGGRRGVDGARSGVLGGIGVVVVFGGSGVLAGLGLHATSGATRVVCLARCDDQRRGGIGGVADLLGGSHGVEDVGGDGVVVDVEELVSRVLERSKLSRWPADEVVVVGCEYTGE